MVLSTVMLFFCLAVLALGGLVIFLLKIGVIVQKVGERPHLDGGTYTLDQGHEVKTPDNERR